MKLICLFIPGVFASSIHIDKLKVKDKEEKIKLYLIYTFLINMFIFIILNFYVYVRQYCLKNKKGVK